MGELAAALELRDFTVSQHLAVLRRERLVRARRDGQTIGTPSPAGLPRPYSETLFRLYCPPPSPRGGNRASPHEGLTQIKDRRPRLT